MVGLWVLDLRPGLCWLNGSVLFPLALGELSGEREGKETRDLAESGIGVTSDCFRDVDRRGADLREEFDTSELLRSRCPLPLLAMVGKAKASAGRDDWAEWKKRRLQT
jgi:hypothetical protein